MVSGGPQAEESAFRHTGERWDTEVLPLELQNLGGHLVGAASDGHGFTGANEPSEGNPKVGLGLEPNGGGAKDKPGY